LDEAASRRPCTDICTGFLDQAYASRAKCSIYAQTIREDERRHCGEQNTTFQSGFMLTTVMP
jgi:hypothetical protein